MTERSIEICLVISLVGGFLLSWITFSLRDFSRSRLADLCRDRGRENRFGEILKNHENALALSELLSAINIVALLGLSFTLLHRWQPETNDLAGWTAYLLELSAIAIVFLLAIQVFPWTLARVKGESLIDRVWPAMQVLSSVGKPYLAFLSRIDRVMHRLTGVEEPTEGNHSAISEEILSVVDEGQREGLIEREAQSMIHRVIELQDVDASSIMTPRTEIVSLNISATIEEARRLMIEEGHSRVPVIGENSDDMRGVIYAKDILKFQHERGDEEFRLEELIREPLYVPETIGVDGLLQTMKSQRVQMAIVLDEYGGVSGLVTMEDVLEEIVGEIDDEYDEVEEAGIKIINDHSILVDGRIHLDELNDQFQYEIPEEGDFDTIAGFVVSRLGRIPEPGEIVSWKQLRISVVEADKRKILRVQIDIDPSLAEVELEESV